MLKTYKRKYIDAHTRKVLDQNKYCANRPSNPALGCRDYLCPLWLAGRCGEFDESGKQIDHIVEVAHGGTNDLSNLQVLCPCCHAVKTKRCAKNLFHFNSLEIDTGMGYMEVDKTKKRKII